MNPACRPGCWRALFAAVALCVLGVTVHAGAYEDFVQAVRIDDGRGVQRLLVRGLDPNTRTDQGEPALVVALRDESFEVADALLAHPGLDLEATNPSGETALMMAALRGHCDWVDRLLRRGARVHREGWSPVLYAASSPDPHCLELVLARGAPVNARSPNGTTPLMMAARYGDQRNVDLLLARGADASARNDRQLSAADFARDGDREALSARLARLQR